MAAGDFSPSVLLEVKVKAEQMWSDSRLAQDFKANAQAAVAVKNNSSARFTVLNDRDHDNMVRVNFVNPCAIAVSDCESNCDITEPEMETAGILYTPALCKKSGFSIDRRKLRTNTYTREELAARGLAQSVKALDEWWAQQILVKLKAFSGINVSPEPYTYAAGTTNVPAANYNISMIPELMYDAMINKMTSPFYIDNGGLWVPYTNAKLNAGNLDGKGDAARIAELNMYFDPFNFGPAGLTEDTFAISSSAVAFVTTNENPDSPELIPGLVQQTLYTVPSQVIPGVKYDVFYGLKCVTGSDGNAHYIDAWRVVTKGDVFLNPQGCPVVVGGTTYTPTGVMSYSKV